MKVLKVFVDFVEAIKELNEAERGRLFTAMLEYARSGAEPVLRGGEKVLWPVAKCNIDNQKKAYEHICAVNKRNVSNRYEPLRTATSRYESKQEKEKNESNFIDDEEEDIDIVYNARAREEVPPEYADAAAAIRAAYLGAVGRPPNRSEIGRLSYAAVGLEVVDLLAEAIDRAARNGAKNIPGYAAALLQEWSENGVHDQAALRRYERIMGHVKDGSLSPAEAYAQLKAAKGG